MTFLKRLLFGEILLLLMATHGMAADDVTTRAMKLYEKHRYEEAARLLRPAIGTLDKSRQGEANLALGMIYLASGVLYRDLYQSALVIEFDYLMQLRKQKTGTPSRYVDLYLGQVLLEAGNSAEAGSYLQKFTRQQDVPATIKSLAAIELGSAYATQKQAGKARNEWSRADKNQPEIKAALAGAYAMAGIHEQKPVLMADAVLRDEKSAHHIPGMRMIRNLLRAYSYSGATEKALDLLNQAELADASFVEDLGASKSISFYDSSLLGDLAKVHLQAAILYLERASRDEKLGNTAAFYLATAYLQQGNPELSSRNSSNFLAQSRIPQSYRVIALINKASAQNMAGRHKEAGAEWLFIAEESAADPSPLAVILLACTQFGGDCTQFEKRALSGVAKGEGKKIFPLNAALGKYYLSQKKYPDAMLHLEAGRDKANKNNIEINDPKMLVGLAEAGYRNKNFSENLEIYFELGKQYPAVRQIQDAIQGIYAMEQQSAGDVKIF